MVMIKKNTNNSKNRRTLAHIPLEKNFIESKSPCRKSQNEVEKRKKMKEIIRLLAWAALPGNAAHRL